MAESSVQRRQVSLPGSLFPPIESTSFSLSLPSPTFMSTTLPLSVLPTVTTTGSALPTSVPNFAWSSYPSTMDTCTSVTLNWTYSGPQETLQFVLISNASPRTQAAIPRKRVGQYTTVATGVDSNALLWTWSKVNVTVGQYVLEAIGTDVTVISSTFTIVDGADTSCLAAVIHIPTSTSQSITSATWSISSSPSPEPSIISDPLQASSGRRTAHTGIIVGGIVAGVTVLIVTVLVYRVRARKHTLHFQVPHSHFPPEPTYRGPPSQYVASEVEPSPLALSEKGADSADPLDAAAADSNSPLVPNRRPPSSLLSEPRTPVPPYTSHIQAREQMAGSVMDVSTVGSRSSVALSDATSAAALMRTMSSCPPSYLTNPSPPPSYATHTRGATTPRSPHWSYHSSSS